MAEHLTSEARASAYAEWRGMLPDGYMQAPFDAGFDAGRASVLADHDSAVSTALAAAEAEREGMRRALAEIRSIANFEFGEMKRKREIMDPLYHSGDIARRALNSEPSDAS